MSKTALVLEGGAMRGVFTSGVLDTLMKEGIEFDCVVGVSAGALIGSNFISKQIGRTAKINIEFCDDPKYIGLGALRKNKGLVGFEYLFGEISQKKVPFNQKVFDKSNVRFVVGATNCETGLTEFFEKGEVDNFTVLQASSSMPVVSSIVEINGKPYLDGAIDCNVPIEWAISEGYDKIVVVLTRPKDYIKEEDKHIVQKLYQKRYPAYPNLVKKICSRPERYNKLYKKIVKLENEGKVYVVRPSGEHMVSRLEKDKQKLHDLYEEGLEIAKVSLKDIKRYLEK